jgi:hypothetical protein
MAKSSSNSSYEGYIIVYTRASILNLKNALLILFREGSENTSSNTYSAVNASIPYSIYLHFSNDGVYSTV